MISIVIPVLNEAEHIVSTLKPLQLLRAQGHEVIVVDGGSTDGTVTLVKNLADRVLVSRPGRAIQMNMGAAVAAHSQLLFLHADTILPEAACDLISRALKSREWGRFNIRLSGTQWLLRWVEATINLRTRISGVATGDQAMFIRREVFEQLGGFPALPLMEDVALSKLLRRRGWPACLKEQVITSSRRWESQGLWRTIFLMWRLRTAWFFGVSAQALVERYYPERIKPPAHIFPQSSILLVAKEPVSGKVKTRLGAELGGVTGNDQALGIHTSLLFRQLGQLTGSPLSKVELWVDGNPQAAIFSATGLWAYEQKGKDLGERMLHAATEALTRSRAVVLIGSDCPALDQVYLQQALAALQQYEVVIGPAEDGGYVLLGLKRAMPELFLDMPWSTDAVLSLTLKRLEKAGIEPFLLPALEDIDSVEALRRAKNIGFHIST